MQKKLKTWVVLFLILVISINPKYVSSKAINDLNEDHEELLDYLKEQSIPLYSNSTIEIKYLGVHDFQNKERFDLNNDTKVIVDTAIIVSTQFTNKREIEQSIIISSDIVSSNTLNNLSDKSPYFPPYENNLFRLTGNATYEYFFDYQVAPVWFIAAKGASFFYTKKDASSVTEIDVSLICQGDLYNRSFTKLGSWAEQRVDIKQLYPVENIVYANSEYFTNLVQPSDYVRGDGAQYFIEYWIDGYHNTYTISLESTS